MLLDRRELRAGHAEDLVALAPSTTFMHGQLIGVALIQATSTHIYMVLVAGADYICCSTTTRKGVEMPLVTYM